MAAKLRERRERLDAAEAKKGAALTVVGGSRGVAPLPKEPNTFHVFPRQYITAALALCRSERFRLFL